MAKFSGALKEFVEKAKERDSYWVEVAKLKFATALDARRKAEGLNYKSLADKLGTSGAYITKVFRGDTNLTIESMVKLARATGGEIDIRIVDASSIASSDWAIANMKNKKLSELADEVKAGAEKIITKNAESCGALIDDAQRGLEDITAGRTQDAEAAIAQLQQGRARKAAAVVKASAKVARPARKRG